MIRPREQIKIHLDADRVVMSWVAARMTFTRDGWIWAMVDFSPKEAAALRDWLANYRTPEESEREERAYARLEADIETSKRTGRLMTEIAKERQQS